MFLTIIPDILVVDGDGKVRSLLSQYLGEQGFHVRTASNLLGCNEAITLRPPDLIILEVMLPDGSGLDFCRDLRNRRSRVPVILLTNLTEDIDRILGLEIGADDYLGKPFNPRELAARIRAVLRRTSNKTPPESEAKRFRFADIALDPQLCRVTRSNGELILLTGAEFDLLKAFLERAGRLLSRDQLLNLTQKRGRDPADRSIDVLVSRLRRKLGETPEEPIFRTIRNGGYQLVVPVATA
ncbi:response regulator [Rhizobium sp. P40RR-XXII]|uniref:response regulator n=1 Tax=unclassified Rhizobium TaxID=2613769 RepID=UPI00145778EC|nr:MULTISPECIES: response regulator [unclassified Rhizobium]NLR86102.1 response regulator [Rhizobium sp. P28RR-XV]NLS18743.1 response regulator [Rhizobium sp. P40RR-XXII]